MDGRHKVLKDNYLADFDTGFQVFTVERLCSCQFEALQRQVVLPPGLVQDAKVAKLTITISGGGISADIRTKERSFSKAEHQCAGAEEITKSQS